MKRSNADGFGLVEVILLVVIVGIIAFVGFRVYEANIEVEQAQNSATAPVIGGGVRVPAVNAVKDLDKLDALLDETDTSASFEQELTTELAY